MTPFFGSNDQGENHIAHPWQPGRLNPDAYRFSMPWDHDTTMALRYTSDNPMSLGAFASGPTRIGIMVMVGAHYAGNPTVPDWWSFYHAVQRWLTNTPSNLYLQVWNEPNVPTTLGGPALIDRITMRDLIEAAYWAAADMGQPDRIIGPAMNPGVPGWESYMADAYSYKRVPAAVHIYPKSDPWTGDWDLAIKQATAASPSPGSSPIYITEAGLRNWWRNGQDVWEPLYGNNWAQYTRDFYLRCVNQSNLRAVIFHRLIIQPGEQSFEFDLNGRLYFLGNDPAFTETALVDWLDPYR